MKVTGKITSWHMGSWCNGVKIDGVPYRLAHVPSRFYTQAEREAAIGTTETLYIDEIGAGRFVSAHFPDGPNLGGPNMTFLDKDNL